MLGRAGGKLALVLVLGLVMVWYSIALDGRGDQTEYGLSYKNEEESR